MTGELDTDVLVIGSGAAGLSLALHVADTAAVTVLAKGPLPEGSTWYAQGGISAVVAATDSFESHVADTLAAGAGLCDPEAVRFTVRHGPASIDWLASLGVGFTRDAAGRAGYHLTREGGHGHRRVIHAADATGRAVEERLLAHARAHPNIRLLEHRNAVDLVTRGRGRDRVCIGAYVLDKGSGRIDAARARAVVLATGGASKAYLYTSNPDGATGDGIAMAWRAGCRVANMEFMQFHPTCLFHPRAKSALISEAVRGEGGRLLLPDGGRFMPRFDERAELAPRDIVARAIDHEMKRLGTECVYLDISHRGRSFVEAHFPNIAAQCAQFGFDLAGEAIPVVPAAHYTCGGVTTDLAGRTDIETLYAIGETACTGLHGANRMASNSLLECLVFARSAASDIAASLDQRPTPAWPGAWDETRVTDSDEEVVVAHNWDELRRFMWDYVGIVRSRKRLERARNRIDLLGAEIAEYYSSFRVTNDLLELRNIAVVADLIIRSAAGRHESRGLHFTIDQPRPADRALPTVIHPGEQLWSAQTGTAALTRQRAP